MWLPKDDAERKVEGNGLVAVAIDKDKGSQYALKWATEYLLSKGQTLILIHVLQKPSSFTSSNANSAVSSVQKQQIDKQTRALFLTFHCYCSRKDIHCLDVTIEDMDIVKALTEYVSYAAIENLVLGVSSRNGFMRKFKISDIPSNASKAAPDFCTVYVISKGKISSVRNASRRAPHVSPLHDQIRSNQNANLDDLIMSFKAIGTAPNKPPQLLDNKEPIKSPFARERVKHETKTSEFWETPESDTDISFISSSRPSTDRMSYYDNTDPINPYRISTSSEQSFGSVRLGTNSMTTVNSMHDFSMVSNDSMRSSSSSHSMTLQDDIEAEMRRLKLELKQTMDMYSTACKEALTAKQKAIELHRLRVEEDRRLEEARRAEEAALAIVEREKEKCRAAVEAAEASQRMAELEAQRRISLEMKALRELEEKRKELNSLYQYRKYTIEDIEKATDFFARSRKIGEGGYGPVFKCFLDHTSVAIKVLRPDAAQGRSQFLREVEVLSCIRHPNMVLLLGACPEYGCLVYEFMANGSLEDRLFRRGNTPALTWQMRFRIAAEIATGLLFLHQTKPEPLVHRDLKPGNILLDHNYVSKISDVGLARLVPPSVADQVTQYRMTSTAGTFCYIDPEYQQTGMLGVKSDVYSLGIVLLQLVTGKSPMGVTHNVERAIEMGRFAEMLDPEVEDWPSEEALRLGKVGLQCAELRRKDRPDLGKQVLPELNKLRYFAEQNFRNSTGNSGASVGSASPCHSLVSVTQDVMTDPVMSGYDSSRSRSSTSSFTGRRSGKST